MPSSKRTRQVVKVNDLKRRLRVNYEITKVGSNLTTTYIQYENYFVRQRVEKSI